MKKTTSKPATKKPAQKKPATTKPSAKPKRKAQGQSELVAIVARLDAIADKLTEATSQLVESAVRLSAAQESQQEHQRQDETLETPGGEVVGIVVVDESEDQ
jgi:hypothetical protein